MNRPPPEERPTADELRDQSAGEPMHIAGKPANVCPYCGCAMFAYHTTTLETRIVRYERCRNCSRKFVTRQPHAEIVREITKADELSSSGNETLKLLRYTA